MIKNSYQFFGRFGSTAILVVSVKKTVLATTS